MQRYRYLIFLLIISIALFESIIASGNSDFNIELDDPTQDVYHELTDVRKGEDGGILESGASNKNIHYNYDYPSADIESLVSEDLGDEFKITLKLNDNFNFNDNERILYAVTIADYHNIIITDKGVLYSFGLDSDYYELLEIYYKLDGDIFEVTLDKRMLNKEEFSPGAMAYKQDVEPIEEPNELNLTHHYFTYIDKVGNQMWNSIEDDVTYFMSCIGYYEPLTTESLPNYEWGTNVKNPELIEPKKPDDKDGIGYDEPIAIIALVLSGIMIIFNRPSK